MEVYRGIMVLSNPRPAGSYMEWYARKLLLFDMWIPKTRNAPPKMRMNPLILQGGSPQNLPFRFCILITANFCCSKSSGFYLQHIAKTLLSLRSRQKGDVFYAYEENRWKPHISESAPWKECLNEKACAFGRVIFFGFPPKTNHTSFFMEPLFCTLFGHMGQALRR